MQTPSQKPFSNSSRCFTEAHFPLFLAPMVGLSHLPLRRVLRRYLPAQAKDALLWPTEMLNSWKLPKEDLSILPESLRDQDETGLAPQILGNEEIPIAQSVKKLTEWGASAIDINMGCPVQKALKHNYGVALMGDADYAAEVVRMTKRHSTLPVSVKLRAGMQSDLDYLLRFARGLEAAGADWITLHPRTAGQKRRGIADWEQISFVKKNLNIPVIGNGDIQTVEDVVAMKEDTGCDRVMSGRALAARPWMLWQLGEKLGMSPPEGRSGLAPSSSLEEGAEYGLALTMLLEELLSVYEESLALRKFRFHLRTTGVWLMFGHDLYAKSTKAKDTDQLRATLQKFFSGPVEMCARTELRQ